MLGIWSEHATTFALVFSAFASLAFGLPFIFATDGWGKAMKWSLPEDRDLMRYYGRCLGFLSLAFTLGMSWTAINQPAALNSYFLAMIFFCAGMVLLHVYGWLKVEQPWTETAEIPVWAAACLGFVVFFPGSV